MSRSPHLPILFLMALTANPWGIRGVLGDETLDTVPLDGLSDVRPGHFALVGATVIPKPGVRLEKATVIIDHGKIIDVGHDVAVPVGARTIDVSGRYIYPGFIDAYDEIELGTAPRQAGYWNSRVTPEASVAEQARLTNDRDGGLRNHGFVARLVAPSRGQFKGVSALVSTMQAIRPAFIRDRVAQHATLTVSFSFDRPNSYPGSPMGAVALARQAMYDAEWYRTAWRTHLADPTTRAPEINVALAALLRADDEQLPWIVDAANEKYALRADRWGREFGLRVIVRGSGYEYTRIDEIVATDRAVILPVDFPQAPDVSTREAALSVSLDRLMHWDLAPENPGRLARAGVRVALTTWGLEKIDHFWPALRRAIRRGLTPADALAALSSTPAKLFGVEDRMGTIAREMDANMVVADGDLFQASDDGAARVVETWVQGQRYVIQPQLTPSLPSKWRLELRPPGRSVVNLAMSLHQAPKLEVQLAFEGAELAVDMTQMADQHLALLFDGKPLGLAGKLRITLVMTSTASPTRWWGEGLTADGTAFEVRALPDDSLPATERGTKGFRGPIENHSDEAGHDSAPNTADKDTADKESSITSSLFEVNYPLGAYGRDQDPDQPNSVCFTHATVWTCGPQGTLADASVLVRQGRIVAVGKNLPVPEGCLIVDATGKHVTPGIIDCHSHIATDGGINEGTQAITAEVRIGDFLDPNDITIYRQLAGGVTAANVLHGSSNPIGGQNQVIKLRWGAAAEELRFVEAPPGIKFALGENVKQSNWGDGFTSRYPQSRMGVDEIMEDAFRRAGRYAERKASWERSHEGLPPRKNLELEALAEVLAGKRWIHCHSYRQSEILALMKTCDRHGIQIGTFQHILEGYKLADEMARRGIMGSAFSDWWAYKFEVYDAIPYAGALMHEAGVVVSFNSDDHEVGQRLNTEAAKAMKYGAIPPEEALKFVTLNPARQLRIDSYVGSIEPGKQADLAIWNGDPLGITTRCVQTWVDGRRYFDLEESRGLEQRDRQRHAALIQRVLVTKAPQIKPEDEEPQPADLWPRTDIYCHDHPH